MRSNERREAEQDILNWSTTGGRGQVVVDSKTNEVEDDNLHVNFAGLIAHTLVFARVHPHLIRWQNLVVPI